jgi:hypothetical protein
MPALHLAVNQREGLAHRPILTQMRENWLKFRRLRSDDFEDG